MSFFALQVRFEKIYYTFAEDPDKLFWPRLKEKTFSFLGKWLEHLEIRENLSVHRPKILLSPMGPGYKTLRECFRCLYNNIIDHLFVATIQPINDRWEQMLRLDTNQLAMIRVPNVH